MPRRVLSHTADTGIEADADSLSGLITELAAGMFETIAPAPVRVDRRREVEIEASRQEPTDLVIDLLSDLLYVSEVEDLLLFDFSAEPVGEHGMTVRAGGVPFAQVTSQGPPIKAVTYHDLEVVETAEGWRGRVYFDV